MAFQLAADKGVKYCYTNSGANLTSVPYNTNEQLVDGMDCCAFVSWAINKGSEEPFHWQGLQGLSSIGDEINYDVALPGDIFVKANSDGSGHVGLIISNDPDNKTFIVAEARGPGYGITLNFINYEELQKKDIR